MAATTTPPTAIAAPLVVGVQKPAGSRAGREGDCRARDDDAPARSFTRSRRPPDRPASDDPEAVDLFGGIITVGSGAGSDLDGRL
jgi:hypothetical protein